MIQYGLWQSVEDIDSHLRLEKSETQKREALKIVKISKNSIAAGLSGK